MTTDNLTFRLLSGAATSRALRALPGENKDRQSCWELEACRGDVGRLAKKLQVSEALLAQRLTTER